VFRLKEKLKPYKKIIRSLTSLSVLQAANYLFPLIILPYVVRVLGPEKYGLVQFAAALNIYFLIICDYGFNLSGTRAVSVYRSDKEKLSQIFSSILLIKTTLFIVAILLLAAIVFSIENFRTDYLVYFASSGMLIGSVLFPLWLFQGLEKMKYITIIHIIVRTFTTALIFLLVRSEDDYITLALLNSITQVLIGIGGIVVTFSILKIKLIFPPLIIIKDQLREGWYLFLSSISTNLYTTSTTFILGILTNNTLVGYYAAADKIRMALQNMLAVFYTSIFPFISRLAEHSRKDFWNFIRRVLVLSSISGLIISAILFIFSEPLILIMLGNNYIDAVIFLKILAVAPFLISISNILGYQVMIPLNYEMYVYRINTIVAVIHLFMLFVLIPQFLVTGAAVSVVISEVFIVILMLSFHKRKGLLSEIKQG
jgi:PST family polysaccharide transporter